MSGGASDCLKAPPAITEDVALVFELILPHYALGIWLPRNFGEFDTPLWQA